MHYLALLMSTEETEADTADFEAELKRYEEFETFAGDAMAWGAALHTTADAATVRQADGKPLITDGPFAEVNEVVGGVYVFQADDLDAALELARRIPAAEDGAVELWPMVEWQMAPDDGYVDRWLALLRNPGGGVAHGTPEWDAGAAEHGKFAESAGDAVRGGGALHPVGTATTVRSRDGEMLLSDGPYAETNEIVNGLYVLAASSPQQAGEIAARIPIDDGCVELRQLVDTAG